jgi:3-hydroxyisobutyrate dehydrogenase
MAKNLQSKLQATDRVSIFDINPEAMKALQNDMKAAASGAKVELAPSAWAASKEAVSVLVVNCRVNRMLPLACALSSHP